MVSSDLLQGALVAEGGPWPLRLWALLCELRPRFLIKERIGPGYRAVARNGRVLLASDRPLDELVGRVARVRLQTWHRAILPPDVAQPYGILLCVRTVPGSEPQGVYATQLVRHPRSPLDLSLAVGGGLVLEFRPSA